MAFYHHFACVSRHFTFFGRPQLPLQESQSPFLPKIEQRQIVLQSELNKTLVLTSVLG